jgi:UMP-CMP kinase
MKLLENAMTEEMKKKTGDGWVDGKGRFLIDGFPRKLDQAIGFDETVCLASLVIFFNTSEDVMLQRLLERAKTSGREDDNVETIRKRFRTYNEQTMPVIEHYRALNKVAEIDSTAGVEEVYRVACATVTNLFS